MSRRQLIRGADCRVVIENNNTLTELPFVDETLREIPRKLVPVDCIGESGLNAEIPLPSASGGCVVTLLTPTSAPIALTLGIGQADFEGIDDDENIIRCFNFQDTPPTCAIYADRIALQRYFSAIRCTSFELRGLTGNPVYLKLGFAGNTRPGAGYAAPDLPKIREAHLRFNALRFTIDGNLAPDIYSFTIVAERHDNAAATIELILHSALSRASGGYQARNLASLGIEGEWAGTRLYLELFDLRLKTEATSIDCADEVIGPTSYQVCGSFRAELHTPAEAAA